MTDKRVNLGFGEELDAFDPNKWTEPPVKAKIKNNVPHKAAEATGFKSREPTSKIKKTKPRRRTTGRNRQFNIKAKAETIEAFYAVADGQNWGLGETLEYAVELLEKSYSKGT